MAKKLPVSSSHKTTIKVASSLNNRETVSRSHRDDAFDVRGERLPLAKITTTLPNSNRTSSNRVSPANHNNNSNSSNKAVETIDRAHIDAAAAIVAAASQVAAIRVPPTAPRCSVNTCLSSSNNHNNSSSSSSRDRAAHELVVATDREEAARPLATREEEEVRAEATEAEHLAVSTTTSAATITIVNKSNQQSSNKC